MITLKKLQQMRLQLKSSFKNCYNQLLENIKSILTGTQLGAWNEWVTKGTSPCDYVPPPPGGSIGGQG